MGSSRLRVGVIQAGARHGHAYARVLAKHNILSGLVTDGVSPGPRLKSLLSRSFSRLAPRLDRRAVLDVPPHHIHSTLSPLIFSKFAKGVCADEERYWVHDEMLGWKARSSLPKDTNVIINTWGNGGSFLRRAQENGIKVVTDVISRADYYDSLDAVASEYPQFTKAVEPRDAHLHRQKVNQILSNSSLLICPSDGVVESLRAFHNFDPNKVLRLSYPILPTPAMTPTTVPGRVLFVGKCSIAKGLHIFLAAAQRILAQSPAATFVVAGERSSALEDAFPAQAIKFIGHVGADRLQEEYLSADVMVLPSLTEGCPAVVGQALSMGVPVIVSETAAAYVVQGDNGFVIRTNSIDEWSDAILNIIRDRQLRMRLAFRARESATEHSLEEWSRQLISALERLL